MLLFTIMNITRVNLPYNVIIHYHECHSCQSSLNVIIHYHECHSCQSSLNVIIHYHECHSCQSNFKYYNSQSTKHCQRREIKTTNSVQLLSHIFHVYSEHVLALHQQEI